VSLLFRAARSGYRPLSAKREAKANQASSDAGSLKTAAIAMFVFLGLSLIPLVPFVYWGFLVTSSLCSGWLIRWRVKFGSLQTSDADYKLAKRSKNITLILWLVAIPLGFIIRSLPDLILAQLL
jgi:hypothetical protein